MPNVSTSLSRESIKAALRQVPGILAGKSPDPTGEGKALLQALGMQALGIVKAAFLVKARGGTDAAGIQWAPLSKKTIAYGRRHPGLEAKRKKAAAEGHKGRPLLTKKQDQLWRAIYASVKAAAMRAGAGEGEASGSAAARAWGVVKAQGGKTIIGEYGNTSVEIGRDTGRMYNSLSPDASDFGPTEQILDVEPGRVAVGTNVKYAKFFHAKRPLWPADNAWPEAWTNRLAETLNDGVMKLLQRLATFWGGVYG